MARPLRTELLSTGTEIELPTGTPIIRQGEWLSHAYLLIDGLVKVTVRDHNGHKALLGIRVGGDLVGEMAAVDGTARTADVVPCRVMLARVIKQDEFLDLMTRHGEFALEVTRMIIQRLRWANRRRLDITAQAPRVRVARVLLDIVEAYGKRTGATWLLGVPLTQAEVAQLTGTGQRSTEKELQQLERDKVIVRRYRGIEIVDIDRLRLIASG